MFDGGGRSGRRASPPSNIALFGETSDRAVQSPVRTVLAQLNHQSPTDLANSNPSLKRGCSSSRIRHPNLCLKSSAKREILSGTWFDDRGPTFDAFSKDDNRCGPVAQTINCNNQVALDCRNFPLPFWTWKGNDSHGSQAGEVK